MEAVLPAFIDIREIEQGSEIRQYLKSAGADLGDDCKEQIHDELLCLLDVCDNWLRSAIDADLEAMMNSFISLILVCTSEREKITQKFCSKITDVGATESNAMLRLRLLGNFFTGLSENNPMRYEIYCSQLKLATQYGLTEYVETKLKEATSWLNLWNVDIEKKRRCYRMLHGALKDSKRSDEATKVMLEILSTYDDKNASEAKDDALQCILHCINKPDVYVMDHLLQLKPVIALEGQPIHKLLKIFVSGRLQDYSEFFEKNSNFVLGLPGVNHDGNIQKMKILTLVSISNEQQEIEFAALAKQLSLNEDEVEEFIIDAVKTGLFHAKLDQVNEKVMLGSAHRRTFEKKEWEELRQKLEQWRENMLIIKGQLEQVVPSNI
eukprot:Seg815.15 transcript_id=Seg815.15/GoldUCD/mRNA.D3Y31 product="Eukaryotic translation initiation factor 3 subunit M" protein_id=Seg815.15/GoldUCD/D3Y31